MRYPEQAGRGIRRLRPGDDVPAVFGPVLERMRAEAASLFGPGDVQLVPVGYQLRPFSHVLRLGLSADVHSAPHTHYFVKMFKPRPGADGVERMRTRVSHEYETTRYVHAGLAAFDTLDTARPIACYPEFLTIVTEEVQGETLMAILEAYGRWYPGRQQLAGLTGTLATVGRWLHAFQSIDPPSGVVQLDDLREYIDHRLRRLVAAGSGFITAEIRDEILTHIARLGAQVQTDDLRRVRVHSDFAPGNVIAAGPRIVVLDFAMSSHGTFLHDVTRLHLQIGLLRGKPRFRPHVVEALQHALLRGFQASLSRAHPLFRLVSLLHRVNNLATLTLRDAPFPARLYNRRLRTLHARWLTDELSQRSAPAETAPQC